MRTITYICNGPDCNQKTTDPEPWLTIGSDKDSLYIANGLVDRKLITMDNHEDIHFCSKQCLIACFFVKEGLQNG